MSSRFCVVFDNVAARLSYDTGWEKVMPKTTWKVAAALALCGLNSMGIAYNGTISPEAESEGRKRER